MASVSDTTQTTQSWSKKHLEERKEYYQDKREAYFKAKQKKEYYEDIWQKAKSNPNAKGSSAYQQSKDLYNNACSIYNFADAEDTSANREYFNAILFGGKMNFC